MTVRELVKVLAGFDKNLSISITDGWDCEWYNLNKAEFRVYSEGKFKVLDIGIGGCKSEASTVKGFLKERHD